MDFLKTFDEFESIKVPIEIGDTILGGRFKNKKTIVKKIDKDENNQIMVNGKPLLKYKIKKTLPKKIKENMKKIKKKEFQKTFENFVGNILKNNNYDSYENISKSNGISGEVDKETKDNILNVENFNNWLANDWNNYGPGRGAPGLIGRIDKLTPFMVEKYFLDQGVECTESEITDFIKTISKKWKNQ